MSLNLHAVARGAIQAVNADISAWYYKSTGATTDSTGRQTPSYDAPLAVRIQAQPPSGRDLTHTNMLNFQGVVRTVFLYSDPQAIVRVDARGGDLLIFPQFAGAPNDLWLVTQVLETWNVAAGGWSKLICTLQNDRPSWPVSAP
jgi:hypothetical protein